MESNNFKANYSNLKKRGSLFDTQVIQEQVKVDIECEESERDNPINFREMLKKYRERTESTMPYTIM